MDSPEYEANIKALKQTLEALDPSAPLYTYSIISPAEGKKEELEAALIGLAKIIKEEEPGSLQWDVAWIEQTGQYGIFERWANPAALESHMQSPHYLQAAGDAAKDGLMSKAPEFSILKPIGGFSR